MRVNIRYDRSAASPYKKKIYIIRQLISKHSRKFAQGRFGLIFIFLGDEQETRRRCKIDVFLEIRWRINYADGLTGATFARLD